MKKRCLVTGVNGFLGQALANRLLTEGYEVYGLYQIKDNPKNDKVIPFFADLTDFKEIEYMIIKLQPQIVIHLAAKTEVAYSFDNYLEVSKVNYLGTVNLAEANRKLNHSLELFIFASTMETYGQHNRKSYGAFTEDTKQFPRAPYAVAKVACEYYLKYMYSAYKFPFVALRQTNTYGRYDNDFFIMERIITQMLKSDVCKLGVPEPWRNFLYVDDLIDLYVTLLKHEPRKDILGEFFVTGPDNALSICSLAEKIKEKLDWHGKIVWGTRPILPGEVYYLNSNPAKAKKILGWEPKIDLKEGIERAIKIWKANYAKDEGK